MKLKLPKSVLRETLVMAFESVRAHKFRSFLTVLGIVIGVMTAITIASILTGLRQNIVAMIEGLSGPTGASRNARIMLSNPFGASPRRYCAMPR